MYALGSLSISICFPLLKHARTCSLSDSQQLAKLSALGNPIRRRICSRLFVSRSSMAQVFVYPLSISFRASPIEAESCRSFPGDAVALILVDKERPGSLAADGTRSYLVFVKDSEDQRGELCGVAVGEELCVYLDEALLGE